MRSNLLPEFGETPIEEITTEWVDSFRARLVEEERLSGRTINKLLVLIHGIFKRAQRVYGLPGNPAAAVGRQPVRRSGDFEVLTPSEVAAVARAAETPQDAALYVHHVPAADAPERLSGAVRSSGDFVTGIAEDRSKVARAA